MKILLPISLDRVRSPISTLLRYVAVLLPKHEFTAGSSPVDAIDKNCSDELWSHPHIEAKGILGMITGRYDIVHHASATSKNLAAARFAKLRSLGKSVHIFTANCEPYSTDPYLRYMELSLKRADVVVAVSEAVAKGVKNYSGRNVDAVIPNGFDEEFYQLPEVAKNDSAPFFLFCAQLLDRKHPEFFLDLAEMFPDHQFIMVGNNPYPDSELAKDSLARIEALPNVVHKGLCSREDVRELMQSATALLFPSDYEGLPLTVVEAMGCGCPVIAQPRSSLPEVIDHEETGWMYLNSQRDEWVGRMTALIELSDVDKRDLACKIRASVIDRFSWKFIAKSYGELYEKLYRAK